MDGVIADFDKRKADGFDPEEPGFFLALDSFEEGLSLFRKLVDLGHDVQIVSTGPWDTVTAWTEKRIWAESHLKEYATKRVTLTHRKDWIHADFLIDDRTKNGAGEFAGELILFGGDKFPNWASVHEYFEHLGLFSS